MFSGMFKQKKPAVRETAELDVCPMCNYGKPLIYDQDHDCCTTCKSKWKVSTSQATK